MQHLKAHMWHLWHLEISALRALGQRYHLRIVRDDTPCVFCDWNSDDLCFFSQSRMRCYEQTGWRDIFRGAVASWESVAEHGLPIPIVSLDSHWFDFPFTKICRFLAINNHYYLAMDHHSWFTHQSALIILNPDCTPFLPRMLFSGRQVCRIQPKLLFVLRDQHDRCFGPGTVQIHMMVSSQDHFYNKDKYPLVNKHRPWK